MPPLWGIFKRVMWICVCECNTVDYKERESERKEKKSNEKDGSQKK